MLRSHNIFFQEKQNDHKGPVDEPVVDKIRMENKESNHQKEGKQISEESTCPNCSRERVHMCYEDEEQIFPDMKVADAFYMKREGSRTEDVKENIDDQGDKEIPFISSRDIESVPSDMNLDISHELQDTQRRILSL